MPALRNLSPARTADPARKPQDDKGAEDGASVSHNLNGQKLGRKGRDTRDRILAAAAELVESGEAEPISLSAVARKASLGMTSLYNYFTDLTELLLAVLEPVMATAEESYVAILREHWPDDELVVHCRRFLRAHFDFWCLHARLLHLRNAMSENHDERMLVHRVRSTQPMLGFLAEQMGGRPGEADTPAIAMATILMTGIERTVTVLTDERYVELFGGVEPDRVDRYLEPEARLMELAIRDTREAMARFRAGETL
jgi:AcrR family transcriptional regulator